MYDPSKKSGIINVDSKTMFNTYRSPTIKAFKNATDKDWQPFIDFMEHLVTVEKDRIELMRWVATMVERPDIEMLYGVLLISETQGIGKTTLGTSILAPLVGRWNSSHPSEHTIVDSNFNDWIAHKRIAVVNEIYAGHSTRAYTKLKSMVTDPIVNVNRKYLPAYDIDNWMHPFACSNSKQAIQLVEEDRRWFVAGNHGEA
jgi:hypothetical protein